MERRGLAPRPGLRDPRTAPAPSVASRLVREHAETRDGMSVAVSSRDHPGMKDVCIRLSLSDSHTKRSSLCVNAIVADSLPAGSISIRKDLLEQPSFKAVVVKGKVFVAQVPFSEIVRDAELEHVEVRFCRAYISRSDMQVVSESLCNRIVFAGEEIDFDYVSFTVSGLKRKRSDDAPLFGVITQDTTINFESQQYVAQWLFVLSKELASVQPDGRTTLDWALDGFTQDLLVKLERRALTPTIKVIAFGRTDTGSEVIDEVVIIEGPQSVSQVIQLLRRRLILLAQRVADRWRGAAGRSTCVGTLADVFNVFTFATDSNLLEALNVCLKLFSDHYIDRTVTHTGQAILLITGGKGLFRVDNTLSQITSRRVLDIGIRAVSLVCVGDPPQHAVPLFEFRGSDAGLRNQRSLKINPDFLYYEEPAWLKAFFYTRGEAFRGFELTAAGSPPSTKRCDLVTRMACLRNEAFDIRLQVTEVSNDSISPDGLRISGSDGDPRMFARADRNPNRRLPSRINTRRSLSKPLSGSDKNTLDDSCFDAMAISGRNSDPRIAFASYCTLLEEGDDEGQVLDQFVIDTDFGRGALSITLEIEATRSLELIDDATGAVLSFDPERFFLVWNPEYFIGEGWDNFLRAFCPRDSVAQSTFLSQIGAILEPPPPTALGYDYLTITTRDTALNPFTQEEDILLDLSPDMFFVATRLEDDRGSSFRVRTGQPLPTPFIMTITPRAFTIFTLQPSNPYRTGEKVQDKRIDDVTVSDMFQHRWDHLFPHTGLDAWDAITRCWLMPLHCASDPFRASSSFFEMPYDVSNIAASWKSPRDLLHEMVLQRLHFNYQLISMSGTRATLTIGHQTHDLRLSDRGVAVVVRRHRGIYTAGQSGQGHLVRFFKWNRLQDDFEAAETQVLAQLGAKESLPLKQLDDLIAMPSNSFEMGALRDDLSASLLITDHHVPSRRIRFVVFPAVHGQRIDRERFNEFIMRRFSNQFSLPEDLMRKLEARRTTARHPGQYSLFRAIDGAVTPSCMLGDGPEPFEPLSATTVRLVRIPGKVPHFNAQTGAMEPVDHRAMETFVTVSDWYHPDAAYDMCVTWLVCTGSVIAQWMSSIRSVAESDFGLRVAQVPFNYATMDDVSDSTSTHQVVTTSSLLRRAAIVLLMRHGYVPDTHRPNFNCRFLHHSSLAWVVSCREGLIWGENRFGTTSRGTKDAAVGHRRARDLLSSYQVDVLGAADAVASIMFEILKPVASLESYHQYVPLFGV